MGTIFGREPVLFLAAVAAVLNLAVGFGLDVSAEQLALANTAVAAVVGFVARSQVTPVKS
jgi:hypothetical protein